MMSKDRRDHTGDTWKKLFQSLSKAQAEVMHKSSANTKPKKKIM